MCPVTALAALVTRVRSYATSWTNGMTNVGMNAFMSGDNDARLEWIPSKDVLEPLKRRDSSGCKTTGIGTNSIRAGACIARSLARVPRETIQLIGR